jgi:hypothetical protein
MLRHLKKILAVFLFGAIFGGSFIFAVADAKKDEPKILPNSPFYFFKDLKRRVASIFAIGWRNQIMTDLNFLDENIKELDALLADVQDEAVIKKALIRYGKNLNVLSKELQKAFYKAAFQKEDATRPFGVFLKHSALLEEWRIKYGNFENDLTGLEKQLGGVALSLVPFINRAIVFQNQEVSVPLEFRIITTLSQWEDEAPPELKEKITALKNDLVLRLEGHLKAADDNELASFLSDLHLDDPRRLSTFEELREWFSDQDLKSRFNELRLALLGRLNLAGNVKDRDASNAIAAAELRVNELEEALSFLKGAATENLKRFLEQSSLNLEQAQKYFQEGRFGASLSQALAAQAVAKNGLNQIQKPLEFNERSRLLKIDFDSLKAEAKAAGKTRERDPNLYNLFDRAESLILSAKSADDLGSAMIILGEIEALLK